MAYFPERVTLDPATPASDVHTFNANVVFGTTVIPSFTSTTVRYFGNKVGALQLSLGTTSTSGGFNLYANSYFDGTNNRFTILNETAANITLAGGTSATGVVYALNTSNNVSHAADATFSYTAVHTVGAGGVHTVGPSTSTTIVHQLNGSLNLLGAVIPSFSSTRYRYVGNKLSSSLYDNGSGAAAGGTFLYGNVYFDGAGNKRSRANETCANLVVNGSTTATGNIFMVSANNSVASAADSAVTMTDVHTIDSNGKNSFGPSTGSDAIVHQMNGSLNLLGTAIPSFSSTTLRYVGSKIASINFLSGSAASSGTTGIYGNMYFDGTNNKFTILNETCSRILLAGTTTAAGTIYTLSADSSISHAADANATLIGLHTVGGTGAHAIGNASTNDALVHDIYGSVNLSGTAIPSFSSTAYRYLGTKMAALILRKDTAVVGQSISYGNAYFDGTTNKRARANETCTRTSVTGTTAANTVGFNIESDASVSHAADSTATFVQTFGVTTQGQMTLGVSTQPVDYAHRVYNGIQTDITTAGTASTVFRNNTSGNVASLILGTSKTTNANLRWIDFAFNGTNSTSPGTAEGYIGTDGVGAMFLFDISDARLKTNLRPFKGAIEELKKAPVYTYDFKDGRAKDIIGILAQDVEKIDSRYVTNHDDIKRIGKDALIHYLHAAILELAEKVEKLEGSKKKTKKDEE